MATNFKGITIQLDVDSTKFDRALKDATRYVDAFDKRLKQVNDALKLDPKNVELISTRAQLLSEKTVQLQNNIKGFQEALDRLRADGVADTDSRIIDLRTNIVKAKDELKKMQLEMWKLSVAKITDPIDKFQKATEKAGEALTKLGKKLRALSTLASGALVAATKSAIDYESAFASVRKTVDETADISYEDISNSIKEMSRSLPSTASQIAEIVALAGQLGVETENVTQFSKAMIDLGNSTNLSSEDAAQMVAQFFNITRGDLSQVENFSSALVELGNNSATTEADIMQLAFRLAGAGSNLGFTQQQILALATALSSAGLKAEAAGGSMSTVLQNIQKEVSGTKWSEANKELKVWGELIGTTGKEFKRQWSEDAYSTFQKVIEGLGTFKDEGGDVTSKLAEMGIETIRTTDSMSRLASAYQLLVGGNGKEGFTDMANRAFAEGDALAVESGKRYETMASQIAIMRNNLTLLGMTIGNAVIPYVRRFTDFIGDNIDKIGEFVERNAEAIVKVLAFVSALAPALLILGGVSKGLSLVSGLISKLLRSKLAFVIAKWVTSGSGLAAVIAKIASFINPLTLFITGTLVYAYRTIDTFKERIDAFVALVVSTVMPMIQDVWDDINDLVTLIWNGLIHVIGRLWEWISLFVAPTLGEVVLIITDIISVILRLVGYLWDKLYPVVSTVVRFIGTLGVSLITGFIDVMTVLAEAITTVVNWLLNLWEEFKKTWLVTGMAEVFRQLADIINNTIIKALSGLVGWVSGAIDKLREFFGLNAKAKAEFNGASVDGAISGIRGALSTPRNFSVPNTGTFQSSGYNSGGLVSNVTINVNNNGKTITANEVRRWASIINEQLGGSF